MQPFVRGDGITPDGQDGVGDQQAYGVLPVAPVPDGQPVHPDHPVEPRDPAHQQHLDDDQVRPHQAGYPPGGRQPRPEALDAGRGGVVPPHVNDAQLPRGPPVAATTLSRAGWVRRNAQRHGDVTGTIRPAGAAPACS